MKRTLFIAIIALVAACGGKKDKPGETPAAGSGSAAPTMAAGSGSAAPTMAGSGSAAPTMAGSGSAAPTMAGSGSAAAPTMAGSGSGSGSASASTGPKLDIPAVADYEDKANKDITEKNAGQQLDDLEKDLAQ